MEDGLGGTMMEFFTIDIAIFFFNHRFNVESKIFQKFETIFSSRTTRRGGRKEGRFDI